MEAWTLGGGTLVRDDLVEEPLDRYWCHASGRGMNGQHLEWAGPACVDLASAMSWERATTTSVLVHVEDSGRWHEGPTSPNNLVPTDLERAIKPTTWDSLRPRSWSAVVRMRLGAHDFETARRNLADRPAVDPIRHATFACDASAKEIEMRCKVSTPTHDLAGRVVGRALRYWVCGHTGLHDELGNVLQVDEIDIAREDGTPLRFDDGHPD